jgi:uncharacterized LabA/DUF88 family protein
MILNNYFFVDGSALLSDIDMTRKDRAFKGKRLHIERFCSSFTDTRLKTLHGGAFKRFTLYFAKNDTRIKEYLDIPDICVPDTMLDIQIKECGKKLQKGSRVDTWITNTNPPNYILERLHKSEKAVDTQICCDALLLAGFGRIDRLFLYTNDFDFIPLCQTLKSIGVNVSLIRINQKSINKNLRRECDSLSVIPKEQLIKFFV